MILALLIVAGFSIWVVLGWRHAAEKLTGLHEQSVRAERLRANVYRQVDLASTYLMGKDAAEQDFTDAQRISVNLLEELKGNSTGQREFDHIEGIEETQYELVWIMGKFFASGYRSETARDLASALETLREIADEVADDVAALSQYYGSVESQALAAATRAGSLATVVVIITAVVALAQFGMLVFLLQRWLVNPIATMNSATRTISAGDLDVHVSVDGADEWSELSQAVNQMVQSLKISQQNLRASERLAALGEVAAYSAHNIRNPLAGIRAAGQVMLSGGTVADPDTATTIREIIDTVDRLDVWLKHLLEFSKPLQLSPAQVDINQLVRQAVELAYRPFAGHRIELVWNLAGDIPVTNVDPVLLEQAVHAISTNAFQAIADEGRVRVVTSARQDEGQIWALISISDSGEGVPLDLQPKLFRIFVTSKKGGTGLGLAQAKRIVDAHGGHISLVSTPEVGTTVEVRLPYVIAQQPKGVT